MSPVCTQGFVVVDSEVDVVGDVEIDISVVVRVSERATGTPQIETRSGRNGDIGKDAVAVVVDTDGCHPRW